MENGCVDAALKVAPTWTVTVALVELTKRLAGTTAVIWVAFTKVVLRLMGVPPHALHQVTFEVPEMKLAPVTVSVEMALDVPPTAKLGETPLIVGAGRILKTKLADTAPLTESATVTFTLPAVVTWVARTVAVMEVEVGVPMIVRLVPPKLTVGLAGKFVPPIVMVKPG